MIFLDSKLEAIVNESDSVKLFDFPFSAGANAVISKRAYPPTEKLLGKHNTEGALFIQILYDGHSDTKYFTRMLEMGYNNKVVILLGTPVHRDGLVGVGNYIWMSEAEYAITKMDWASYGTLVHECPEYCLERFLITLDERLHDDKISIYKSVDPEFINDWRGALRAMPLMTDERVEYIYNKYKEQGYADALNALVDPRKNEDGFGRIMCVALRDWMKIPDGFTLTYEYIKEEE